MTDNDVFRFELVAPVFLVTDVKRSLAYYTEKLLFQIAFEWKDGDGAPLSYSVVRQGKSELHLSLAKTLQPTVAYFFLTNVEAYFETAKARGATISHNLEDQPWDMREFEARDPDDNRLIFGEHLSRIAKSE